MASSSRKINLLMVPLVQGQGARGSCAADSRSGHCACFRFRTDASSPEDRSLCDPGLVQDADDLQGRVQLAPRPNHLVDSVPFLAREPGRAAWRLSRGRGEPMFLGPIPANGESLHVDRGRKRLLFLAENAMRTLAVATPFSCNC